MSFTPSTVSFLWFQVGSQVYVFDSTANCYFSVNSFCQQLLVPVNTNLVPVSACSQPAALAFHRLLLTTKPQLHDYTAENKMLFRLAKATWPTGKSLHYTNSGDICRLYQEVSTRLQSRLSSWNGVPNFVPSDLSHWNRIWGYKRASKESCILWKLMFQANATQRWRFPTVQRSDHRLHCALCVTNSIEDEFHLFWKCPYAARLWKWVFHLLSKLSSSDFKPGPEHVLLSNPLPRPLLHLQHWWDLLRRSMLWNIWLHRNALAFQTEHASLSQTAIACKVWCQMRRYISISLVIYVGSSVLQI
jgi:hypothetical protein